MTLFDKLPTGVTRLFGKVALKLRKASPEIFIIGGIGCGVAALVLVGTQTWKGKDAISEDVKLLQEAKKEVTEIKKEERTEEDKKKVWVARLNLGKDVVRTYWLPATLGISSVGLIWGGRTALRRELSAVTAAYTALAESYRKYREKVIAEYGREKDEEFQYGAKVVEAIDAETGEMTKKLVVNKEDNLSRYAFFFDGGDENWKNTEWNPRDKLANRFKVLELQREYTWRLRTIGYAWCEEMAIDFGMDPEEAYKKYHNVGWLFKEGRENRVELGVLEGEHQLEVNKGFTDDRCSQNVCLINPNVDGYIGYIRDNYRKYDRRYITENPPKYKSLKRRMLALIDRTNKEKMEHMVLDSYYN